MAEMKWNCLYFDEWVKGEGLELIRGHKVEDVFTQPLKPWARTGGNAVQIQLQGVAFHHGNSFTFGPLEIRGLL